MNFLWIYVSFLAMLATSIGCIGLKVIDNSKYDNLLFFTITFIIMGFISFIYLITNNKIKNKLFTSCDKYLIIFTFLFASILIINNFIIQYAFKISPNIAYSHIIINLNIILSVIAAYFLFKQKLNLYCVFGIFLTLIGIMFIAYNSSD